MDLQFFVTDTEEWPDRFIHIEDVVMHTSENGEHKVWIREDIEQISPTAQRFYVKDYNIEDHKGAAYVIPDHIVISYKVKERELKRLTAGPITSMVVVDVMPSLLDPNSRIDEVISQQTKDLKLASRAAGYLREAVEKLGAVTLNDLAKKASRRKLATMKGVKEKTLQNIEGLLADAGLHLRD